MPRGWEGNRTSGVALAMYHRLQWLSTYGLTAKEGRGIPQLHSSWGIWHTLRFNVCLCNEQYTNNCTTQHLQYNNLTSIWKFNDLAWMQPGPVQRPKNTNMLFIYVTHPIRSNSSGHSSSTAVITKSSSDVHMYC